MSGIAWGVNGRSIGGRICVRFELGGVVLLQGPHNVEVLQSGPVITGVVGMRGVRGVETGVAGAVKGPVAELPSWIRR